MGTVPFFSPRRGISLLEILFSIAILAVGLFGVAALIPLGKISLMETEKADRTGACGRAALREVRIRGMLNPNMWTGLPSSAVFAIDPLGCQNGLTGALGISSGAIHRIGLAWANTIALADANFRWHDDLIFVRPEEMTSGAIPPAGTRPVSQGYGADDAFSWFLTATPSLEPNAYSVSVVVCQKRVLTQTGGQPDGEEATGAVTVLTSPGYGGATIQINTKWPTKWTLNRGDWILLYAMNGTNIIQAAWYRVAYVGDDGTNTTMTLVGPDWYGGTGAPNPVTAVAIEGVTGVYTTTVQLN